ncbi:CopD family protein [Alphaproteobacteria bacterium]|nr:CopD family protein [Alphaproteobacteria bacterium]
MSNYYLIIKSLHIISFTAWMAGMFYLPRIFVYHSEKNIDKNTYNKFLIMEKKLIKIIMNPALILTWLFGVLLILYNNYSSLELWLVLKLIFVFLLSGAHGFFSYCYKLFLNNKNNHSPKFYRYINEVPTVLFIVIVFLVILKPTF